MDKDKTFKILQLNIEHGKRINNILEFLKTNDFDIIHLQEVAGGERTLTNIDCFDILSHELKNYRGVRAKSYNLIGDKDSYFGNATFVKNSIKVIKEHIIRLTEEREIDKTDKNFDTHPYCAIRVRVEIGNKKFDFINTHLTWGILPYDTPLKLKNSKVLFDYLDNINSTNIILTGDFNSSPETETVSQFEKFGRNLTKEYKVTNTLNYPNHKLTLKVPEGIACDYIFCPFDLKVIDFKKIDNDLSDHCGLIIEF